MEGSQIALLVGVVIVVGAIIAFVVTRSGSRREQAERAKAAEMREQAAEHDRELREREAAAQEAKAQAEAAEAEVQERKLEAERLAQEAHQRANHAGSVREERDEQLRLADLRDPDVRTDDDGYRIDEHGNRLGTGTTDHGLRDVDGHHDADGHHDDLHDDLHEGHVHDGHLDDDHDGHHQAADVDLDGDGVPDRLETEDDRSDAYDEDATLTEEERREAAMRERRDV